MALLKFTQYKDCTLVARQHADEGWVVEIVTHSPKKRLKTPIYSGLSDAIGEAQKMVDYLF